MHIHKCTYIYTHIEKINIDPQVEIYVSTSSVYIGLTCMKHKQTPVQICKRDKQLQKHIKDLYKGITMYTNKCAYNKDTCTKYLSLAVSVCVTYTDM